VAWRCWSRKTVFQTGSWRRSAPPAELSQILKFFEGYLFGLVLAAVGVGGAWAHSLHSPARRIPEREEEQDPCVAEEGVCGAGLELAVDFEVGEHERLGIGVALERNRSLSPHGAVCTVAADEVPGLELLGRAVPAAEGAGDGRGVLPERDQLEASFDADVLGGEMLVQERFGLGLGMNSRNG
jgi:hypothetical protein